MLRLGFYKNFFYLSIREERRKEEEEGNRIKNLEGTAEFLISWKAVGRTRKQLVVVREPMLPLGLFLEDRREGKW